MGALALLLSTREAKLDQVVVKSTVYTWLPLEILRIRLDRKSEVVGFVVLVICTHR